MNSESSQGNAELLQGSAESLRGSAASTGRLYLGCPVWGCDRWEDQVYPRGTPRRKWLHWYSQTFNAVEGNSTFYAFPTVETTRRWAEQTTDGFRFSLKFPRRISHEIKLVGAAEETREFLRAIEPLASADRLGPTFLQLGPDFGPDRIGVLFDYLSRLPTDLCWGVEFRHHGWFDDGPCEDRVNEFLSRRGIDTVLFDSRPLYQSPPGDEAEAASQKRKPRTPFRQTVTGDHPMLRLIGRDQVSSVDHYLQSWAKTITRWLCQGLDPVVFTHAPDDAYAPSLARRLLMWMKKEMPGLDHQIPYPPRPAEQLSLLGD